MARKFILDRNWAGRAFLVPPSALSDQINNKRWYHTSSSRKFTDTTLGGNFAMNPLSQFTENCDISHGSIYSAAEPLGRWYSEVLEDNSQLIHIRAGVPKFNSMTNFFGNFYNVHAGSVARSGRGPSAWFRVGQVAGFLGTLPLQPFILAGTIVKFFAGMPRSKYWYLKPTMYPYWYAVSSMVNGIMVNMGIAPRTMSDEQKRFFDPQAPTNKADVDALSRIYGDVLMKDGTIDVFAISTKAQRRADAYRKAVDQALEGITGNPATRAEEFARIMQDGVDAKIRGIDPDKRGMEDYEAAYLAFHGQFDESKIESVEADTTEKSWVDQATEAALAEARMGADFVTFRVNHTGSQSESFNNSSTDSSIQNEINEMSSKASMARYNFADGNLGAGLGWVADAVKEVAAGALRAFQAEGLIAVAGNAFADIQKLYQSSSADLNRTSFTIPLRSWAADDWVRLKNLFLPLSAILALALPRATGNSSYTSPFMLEVFNQGRTQIREGMIESITIERGVGDIGWGKGGKCLGIDVTVTIVDLSSILSVPINPGFGNLDGLLTGAAEIIGGEAGVTTALALNKSTYAEDNKYTDYLATLASLPLEYQINMTRKWLLNMARGRAAYSQWKSPHRVVSALFSTLPGEGIKAISFPTSRD